MSGGGRIVEVGIRRLRVRWIEEVVVEQDIVCCGGGLVSTVVVVKVVVLEVGWETRWRCKVEREGGALARDFCEMACIANLTNDYRKYKIRGTSDDGE
jgi:hypothetical protein